MTQEEPRQPRVQLKCGHGTDAAPAVTRPGNKQDLYICPTCGKLVKGVKTPGMQR
jgi:hypothetical protein